MTTPQTPAELAAECKRLAAELVSAERTSVQDLSNRTGILADALDRALDTAIDQLAALAASAQQEPVGEVVGHHKIGYTASLPTIRWSDRYWPNVGTKLYAAPVASQAESPWLAAGAADFRQAQAEPSPVAAPPVVSQQLTTAPADVLEEALELVKLYGRAVREYGNPCWESDAGIALKNHLAAHLRAAPVPLTETELERIWRDRCGIVDIARAIEAHHGITGSGK